MILRRALIAGLIVFAATSCGGDDSSKIADMIEEATGGGNIGGDDMSGDEPMSGNYDFELTGNRCLDALMAFNTALSGFTTAIIDANSFNIESYRKNMTLARNTVADSIKPDFDRLANAYDLAAEAIVKAQSLGGFASEAGVAELDKVTAVFDDSKLQESVANVGVYFASECAKFYNN
jgi:hypothetical protein